MNSQHPSVPDPTPSFHAGARGRGANTLDSPERLHVLRETGLLDGPPDPRLDRLARLAARTLHAPVSTVTLVDAARQVFAGAFGLPEALDATRETPLPWSFCRHTLGSSAPLAIPDTAAHPLAADNPAVRDLDAAAYLGVPLRTGDGYALGALCVLDRRPRRWKGEEVEALADVAQAVAATLDLRRRAAERSWTAQVVAHSNDAIVGKTLDGIVTSWNRAAERLYGYAAEEMLGQPLARVFPPERRAEFGELMARVARGEEVPRFQSERLRKDGERVQVSLSVSPVRDEDGRVVGAAAIVCDETARRRMDDVLRLHARALASVREGIVVTDAEAPGHPMVYANPAVERITGYPPAELIGRNGRMMQGPGTDPRAVAQLREAVRTGSHCEVELLNYRRDGTPFWNCISVTPVTRPGGAVSHFVGVLQDTTERRAAREALQEREREYRLLFDTNPQPMWVFDHETLRFLAVNAAAVRHYGYSREEFQAMTLLDIRPDEDRAALARHVDEAVRRGGMTSLASRHLTHGGESIDVELDMHPLVFLGRQAQLVVVTDVTQRRRAERALRESEERFRLMVEGSEQAFFYAYDASMRLEYLSPSVREVLGYEPEPWIGRSYEELLVDAADRDELDRRTRRILETGERTGVRTAVLRHADGHPVTLEFMDEALLRDGRVVGVRGFARDVTARLRLEEQLRQSSKMEAVGRLAAGVAHDFNNLLTAIRGNVELALDELPPGDLLRDDLDEVREAATRAADLTRQLLAFGRSQVLQPRALRLNEQVDASVRLLRRLIGEDVLLVVRRAPRLGPVNADPTQVEQVLLNLAVNARDAMPGGGELFVETRDVRVTARDGRLYPSVAPGHYAMLMVVDTGTGMDETVRERLFEPFFTTKPAGKGTGLGLSTVYGIVKQSGGEILVDSEPGWGTTFRVLFPVVAAPAGEAGAERRDDTEEDVEEGREARRGGTVLLVEDEAGVRRIAGRILARDGYTVIEARDGEEGLQVWAENRDAVDLVLTDVVMPRMSGREMAARMRSENPAVRVLFMSGYTEEVTMNPAALPPGTRLIAKPFSPAHLLDRVREALDASARG